VTDGRTDRHVITAKTALAGVARVKIIKTLPIGHSSAKVCGLLDLLVIR